MGMFQMYFGLNWVFQGLRILNVFGICSNSGLGLKDAKVLRGLRDLSSLIGLEGLNASRTRRTEAPAVPSESGRSDALLRRMLPYLT